MLCLLLGDLGSSGCSLLYLLLGHLGSSGGFLLFLLLSHSGFIRWFSFPPVFQ